MATIHWHDRLPCVIKSHHRWMFAWWVCPYNINDLIFLSFLFNQHLSFFFYNCFLSLGMVEYVRWCIYWCLVMVVGYWIYFSSILCLAKHPFLMYNWCHIVYFFWCVDIILYFVQCVGLNIFWIYYFISLCCIPFVDTLEQWLSSVVWMYSILSGIFCLKKYILQTSYSQDITCKKL